MFQDSFVFYCRKKWIKNNQNLSHPKTFFYYFNEPAGFLPTKSIDRSPFSRCSYMACHGSDIPYLLGLHDYFQQVEITPGQHSLAMIEQGYFSNFIRNGDVNDFSGMPVNLTTFMENSTYWDDGVEGYLELAVSEVEFRQNDRVNAVNNCDFWDDFDEYGQH